MLMAAIPGINNGALNVPRQLIGAARKIGANDDGVDPQRLNVQGGI